MSGGGQEERGKGVGTEKLCPGGFWKEFYGGAGRMAGVVQVLRRYSPSS